MYQQLTGHITQADKARSDYFYVPFILPIAARRLHVSYSYSAAMSSDQITGGNVIDLGLFDPRGAEFPGGAGFRGWSGSARGEFTITPDDATPGYLPGPLPAGQYQVILGLYRIWEEGADYAIEITAELDDNVQNSYTDVGAAPRGYPGGMMADPPAPLVGEPTRWLRGDLQSHTHHSDAKGSLEQLTAKARALGLDFLAVTDHNTISHHRHLAALADEKLILLVGQEVTTYYGHMNVWNTQHWCDFRCQTAAGMRAIIDLAHATGGLCSINHPKQGGPAWEYGFDLPVDTLEVWQGPWAYRNAESLALWDRLLTAGKQLRAVGGSDYHCPAAEDTNLLRLGQPTTWVQVKERSERGILEALAAGRTSISASPTGPRIALVAEVIEGQGKKLAVGKPSGKIAMGEVITAAEAEQLMITATVWDGAGLVLHFVIDGKSAMQYTLTAPKHAITITMPVTTYVRAELVGALPVDQLPPIAPTTVDRSDWRWALSNPIFVEQPTDGN